MRLQRNGSKRSIVASSLVAAVAAVMCVAGVPSSFSALRGTIGNSTDTSASTGYFTCTAAVRGGGAYSAWPLNDTSGLVSANDVSGNNHLGTYTLLGITYQVAGPCPRDGAKAETFDGLTGSVSDTNGFTATTSQSDEIWFKTTTALGGLMIGSYADPNIGTGDRVLYMNSNGNVVFGVNPGTVKTIVSPTSYNDGNWHLADGVLSSTGGLSLYVDGQLVASDSTTKTAGTGTVYTRVGRGTLAAYPNAGGLTLTVGGFAGSLAFATIYKTAISSGQVAAMYTSGH